MKINKEFFLVVFNIGFAIFLGNLMFGNGFLNLFIPLSIGSLLHHYLPTFLMLFFLFSNLGSAYSIIHTKDKTKKNLRPHFLITIHTVVWFLILFLGYFFVSNLFFPIVAVLIIAGDFLFLKKVFKKKIYILFSLITVTVIVSTILFGFEEDYCWKKGDEADPTGSKIVAITGTGVAWQAHMKCHDNFNFINALEEKYLFIR